MGRRWTNEEIQFLKKNYRNITAKEIAKKLNRTITSIHNMARKLKIVKHVKKWNKEMVLRELKNFAKKIGHSPSRRELIIHNRYDLLKACIRYFETFNNAKKLLNLKEYSAKDGGKFKTFKVKKTLSPEVGYIIGVILGDGNITKSGIYLTCKDKDFVDYFASQIEKWSGKAPSVGFHPSSQLYFARFSSMDSKKFFETLLKPIKLEGRRLYIYTNLSWILNTTLEFQKQVFKGFFDSEGNIFVDTKKGNYGFSMWNTDKNILLLMKKIGKKFGLKCKIYKENRKRKNCNTCYIAHFGGIPNLLNLYNNIGITIMRKRKKAEIIVEGFKNG